MEPRLAAPNTPIFLNANLRIRALSSVILIPLAVLTVYVGGWVFAVVATVITGMGLMGMVAADRSSNLPQPVAVFAYGALAIAILSAIGQWGLRVSGDVWRW